MMRKAGNTEAARLHYLWCAGCGEYKSHTIVPQICRGNCGLVVHDDPRCPLVGKVMDVHTHTPECYDC